MRLQQTLLYLLGFITTIQALAVPAAFSNLVDSSSELYKRKGGGGGRGGGGSSSSGSSGSSGSRGSSGSSGSGTSAGSGTPRNFGGGSRYGGGAAQPYRAGGTPSGWRGPAPLLLGVGALALFPGLWLYGAYSYRYSDDDEPQEYFNETSGRNESRPVECLCAKNADCGCEIGDRAYLDEAANDPDIASVRNGTLYLNGTLEEGTTAPGSESTGAAGGFQQKLAEAAGWWPLVAGVTYTMWFL